MTGALVWLRSLDVLSFYFRAYPAFSRTARGGGKRVLSVFPYSHCAIP
jgi:hypothetical protein